MLKHSEVEKRKTPKANKGAYNSFSSKDIKPCSIVNSETSFHSNNSLGNILGNKEKIIEILKFLKFQKSSIDHQKYCYEKLYKNKTKNFCFIVSSDKKKNLVREF